MAHNEGGQNEGKTPERLEELMAARRAKLDRQRSEQSGRGGAFPNDFRPDSQAAKLLLEYGQAEEEKLSAAGQFALAGRLMRRRVMGKASFASLRDGSGDIQLYLRADQLGEDDYAAFKDSDIGDLVGVTGTLMRTQKGELSLQAQRFRLLTKALRPLPDKHAGLADIEARARQRYLDLLLGGAEVVRARAAMNAGIRSFLDQRGYLEVETPMMHPIPGGANALPFITHHNSLNRDLYLRVAPELYLKQLLVGGLERIYELNRNFRNEGVSSRHNPEFTLLEFYRAWADWNDGMEETEQLLEHLAHSVTGGRQVQVDEETFDLSAPFRRQSMVGAVAEALGVDHSAVTDREKLAGLARELPNLSQQDDVPSGEDGRGERSWDDWNDWGQLLVRVFEKAVEPGLRQPMFVTHFPLSVSPLARPCTAADDADGGMHPLAERWELLIGGREIAGGFSELNDAQDQARRLTEQAQRKEGGDGEAMAFDREFVRALEYGMPPASGVGMGMDRVLMLLTGTNSVRQVILFPQLRR